MAETISEFVRKLHADARFRNQFADDPAGVLRDSGLDPDALELPDKIDPDALARRLDTMLASSTAARDQVFELYDAQKLWDEFGWIRWKSTGSGNAAGSGTATSITTATVIYGTSAVTSQSSNVTVTSSGRSIHSVEQLARLRALARLPAEQIRFAVISSDGERIEGLDAQVVRAFVERLG